jgi:hypothetical protein
MKARVTKRRAPDAPSKGKPARKAPPAKKAAPARRSSKTAKILDLLKRPGGVTLKELPGGCDVGPPSALVVPAIALKEPRGAWGPHGQTTPHGARCRRQDDYISAAVVIHQAIDLLTVLLDGGDSNARNGE